MANFDALKRKGLGAPPSPADTGSVLEAPETAPSAPVVQLHNRAPSTVREMDGRSARKTGRTVPFATRVSETFDEQFRKVARADGLLLAQLLEKALEAYEAQKKGTVT